MSYHKTRMSEPPITLGRRVSIAADDVEKQYPSAGLPARNTTFTIPRSITIQDDRERRQSVSRDLDLRRQNSVSFATGPVRVEPSTRIVGEFR